MAEVKIDLREVDRGMDALLRELGKLKDRSAWAKVGVLGKAAERQTAPGEAPQPLSNVDIAMVHEFGTDAVPQRSFLRSSFDAHQAKYLEQMRVVVGAVYDGRLGIKSALGLVGLSAASDTRNLVRAGSGIPPPNSPATIARKGSSHTLIDTGQLINAIQHDVVVGE